MPGFLFSPWLAVAVAPFIGSFLGVVIQRLPRRDPALLSRSACEHCGLVLQPRDLVPVASFVLLRGRCRHCGGAIGWFHPVVEIAATGVAFWAVLTQSTLPMAWISCLLGWALLTLAWIDAISMLLPDIITLPLLLGGLGVAVAVDPASVFWHAVGALAGYLVLRCVGWSYRAWRGQDGLGEGDAKLLAAAGAWVGAAALPWIVLLAALGGLGWALVLSARGQRLQSTTALPFGPFLAAATWLIWQYGAAWGLT